MKSSSLKREAEDKPLGTYDLAWQIQLTIIFISDIRPKMSVTAAVSLSPEQTFGKEVKTAWWRRAPQLGVVALPFTLFRMLRGRDDARSC